ncbi:MAG: hypothetical protein K5869_08855 [Saccharofermentans sp.]|nr:hypothetical protein [Saccharofermentans sp.]
MNNRGFLLTTGALAFLSVLAINGVPFGSGPLEIFNLIVFFAGLIAVLVIGLFLKNDKIFMFSTVIYTVVSVALIMAVEVTCKDFILAGIGFFPGLCLSIAGLIRTRKSCREAGCYIVNGIALVVSLLSLALAFFTGNMIIVP